MSRSSDKKSPELDETEGHLTKTRHKILPRISLNKLWHRHRRSTTPAVHIHVKDFSDDCHSHSSSQPTGQSFPGSSETFVSNFVSSEENQPSQSQRRGSSEDITDLRHKHSRKLSLNKITSPGLSEKLNFRSEKTVHSVNSTQPHISIEIPAGDSSTSPLSLRTKPSSPMLFNRFNVASYSKHSRKYSLLEASENSPTSRQHFIWQMKGEEGIISEEEEMNETQESSPKASQKKVPSFLRQPQNFSSNNDPQQRSLQNRRFTVALEKPSKCNLDVLSVPLSKDEELKRLDEQRLKRFLNSSSSLRRDAVHEENLGVSREMLKERMELLAISNALEACF